MYHIRHAGPKGFGLFAKTAIARGTRVVAEQPTFRITSDHGILTAFKTLSVENKAYISQLSTNSSKELPFIAWAEATWHVLRGALRKPSGFFPVAEYKHLLAAFRNNSFRLDEANRALFHDISRLNHSCVPNAQGNFNSAIGRFTIHATQAIAQGEEVTISYLPEHGAVRAARQARLWEGYGFVCGCVACDGSTARGQEGERRRVEVKERLGSFARSAAEGLEEGDEGRGELKVVMGMIRMFEEEGLGGRELGTMYLAAAESNFRIKEWKEAKECARLGLEAEERCLGTDSPLYKESVVRMRKI